MEKRVVVGIAESFTVNAPDCLVSYALGSCVGVCLYDYRNKIAGMVHILLPHRNMVVDRKNPYKFADSGIHNLLCQMYERGAQKRFLYAKIAGGAEMFQYKEHQEGVGIRNTVAVKQTLQSLSIPVRAADTGGNYGRTIYFDSSTGSLKIKSISKGTYII